MTVLWVMLSFFLREAFPDKGGPEWRVFPLIGILGAYIFVVFGFLSRRCERQADIYGCRAVSCRRGDCCGPHGGGGVAPRRPGAWPAGHPPLLRAPREEGPPDRRHPRPPGG